MGEAVIRAYADHFDVVFLQLIGMVSQVAGFFGAARRIIFRIEIDNNPFPFVYELRI